MILEGTGLAKPFLKWAGGKGSLLPQLKPLFPEKFNNYYEPFVGGGAVFFNLPLSGTAYINDINSDLMATYAYLKNDIESIVKLLSSLERKYTSLDEDERQAFYYLRREEFNNTKSGLRKSVLLIFLNRTCFNGLYRENSKGKFNVPFGRYVNPKICNEDNLRAVHRVLKATEISKTSYKKAVESAEQGDFVYFDPPYYPLNATSSFTAYHETGFSREDQAELRNLFVELDKRGCYVMLSNSSSEYIKDLYKDFRQEVVYAGRNINASGTKRGKIPELVVTNY